MGIAGGIFQNGSNQCKPCNVDNCYKCGSNGKCLQCKKFVLNGSQLGPVALDGYGVSTRTGKCCEFLTSTGQDNKKYQKADNRCRNCPTSCLTCDSTTGFCLTCPAYLPAGAFQPLDNSKRTCCNIGDNRYQTASGKCKKCTAKNCKNQAAQDQCGFVVSGFPAADKETCQILTST